MAHNIYYAPLKQISLFSGGIRIKANLAVNSSSLILDSSSDERIGLLVIHFHLTLSETLKLLFFYIIGRVYFVLAPLQVPVPLVDPSGLWVFIVTEPLTELLFGKEASAVPVPFPITFT
jgi:hypothetical protein